MADKYFIHPIGQHSNRAIFQNPALAQEIPDDNAECFFGKTRVILPAVMLPNKPIYDGLKLSDELSFFAFIQKGKGKKQFLHCQNVKNKPILDPFVTHLLQLVSQIPKEEIPKEEEALQD